MYGYYERVHVPELRSLSVNNFFTVSRQCQQGKEVISLGRGSSPSIFHPLFDLLQLQDPRRFGLRLSGGPPAGPKPPPLLSPIRLY